MSFRGRGFGGAGWSRSRRCGKQALQGPIGVDSEHHRSLSTIGHDACRAGANCYALKEVERDAKGTGEGGLDAVGVAHGHDDFAGVLHPVASHDSGEARLKLEKRLAARKPEARRIPLDRAPLGELGQLRQLLACPLAEVAFEETSVDVHPLTQLGGKGSSRLPGALEGGGVDSSSRYAREPAGSLGRLGQARFRQVQAACPPWEDLSGRRSRTMANEAHDSWWLRLGARPRHGITVPFTCMDGVVERERLATLAERVTSCKACPRLVGWREETAANPRRAFQGEKYWGKPLAGFGDAGARLVLVGLAPAAHGGNRTGRMFTGDQSGDFLFAALWRAGFANQPTSVRRDDGLVLTDAYITAAVRCAPPGNAPTPEERDACQPFLAEELGLLTKAIVYLALGEFAYKSLARTPPIGNLMGVPRQRFGHGAEVQLAGDAPAWLLCSYHPSQQNVFTGRLTAAMFDAVLERAKTLVNQQ